MQTTNNKFTVESLVFKYRNYVKDHCPKEVDAWTDDNGSYHEVSYLSVPDAAADEQLLVTLYNMVTGDKADVKILKVLSDYAKTFYKNVLSSEELSFLCEHFTEVVSYEFDNRSDWVSDCYASRELHSKRKLELVKEYIKPEYGSKVYIQNPEVCDLAVHFNNCTIIGANLDDTAWALGQIRMFAAGIKSEIITIDDVNNIRGEDGYKLFAKHYIETLSKESLDVIIWGASHPSIWYDGQISSLYNKLKPGGKMLFFTDFWSELAGNEHPEDVEFRKQIVGDKSVSSIIEISNKDEIFDTSIMLEIKKTSNETVCIKDEIKSVSKCISASELDCDILWPSYYLAEHPEGKPLSSVVRISDERLAKFVKGKGVILPEEAKNMNLILSADLADEYKNANLKDKTLLHVSDSTIDKDDWWEFNVVKAPCILLSGNTEKIKVGYITEIPPQGLAYWRNCCCFIPKIGIDVRYVASLLLQPSVSKQIVSICEGRVTSRTLSFIFDKIILPRHKNNERMKYLAEVNYDALISSQEELREQTESYKKSVRLRKHAITQSLSSLEALFYALNIYRIQQNGVLSDNDKISPISNITVGEAFDDIAKSLKDMMPVIEHIADVEYSFKKPEWIDPALFIDNYISCYEKGWINFSPITSWEKGNNQANMVFKNSPKDTIVCKKGESQSKFLFPYDALERIFNNIISNAKAHGFTDNNRKDYKIRFSWHTDDISIFIEIENNGTPIPYDRDAMSLLEYGVSTALHQDGHSGIGCNEIDDIMRRYDGKVELISSPNCEFTVKYILTFNKTAIVKS